MPFEIRLRSDENLFLFSVGIEDRTRIIETLTTIAERETPDGESLGSSRWRLQVSGWVLVYEWNEEMRLLRVTELRPNAKD